MKKFNMANVTRAINKAGFKLKKHSPEILIVAGVVGVVTSAVMACKATMKLNDTLTDTKEKVEDFHADEANYTEEEGKKTLTLIYSKAALDIAKLYGPSVVLGGLSITAILTSNNILRKRNIALAAAYTAVDKSFKEYRGRVIERFGKELDRELKYNIKAKEVEETVVSEDGTEVVEKKTIELADPNTYSPYAKFYDDGCSGWTKDSEARAVDVMMSNRGQNGNSDVVAAINRLGKKLSNMGNTYNSIDGVTYDESSSVSNAIQTLTRAVVVEGRR